MSAERRRIGNRLAAVGAISAGAAVVGSFLPWMHYHGGDGPHIVISGLQGGETGSWTLITGLFMIMTSICAGLLDSPGRTALVALPAVVGLLLTAFGWQLPVDIGTGERISGDTGYGLVVTGASFAVAATGSIVLWSKDLQSWRREQPTS